MLVSQPAFREMKQQKIAYLVRGRARHPLDKKSRNSQLIFNSIPSYTRVQRFAAFFLCTLAQKYVCTLLSNSQKVKCESLPGLPADNLTYFFWATFAAFRLVFFPRSCARFAKKLPACSRDAARSGEERKR